MTTSSVDQTLLSASSFTGSIGVNTHVAYAWGGYNNLALMDDDLKYLGVTTLRDALANIPAAAARARTVWRMTDTSSISASRRSCRRRVQRACSNIITHSKSFVAAHPGSIIALEGLNEANTQPFSYNGSSTSAAAANFRARSTPRSRPTRRFPGSRLQSVSRLQRSQGFRQLGNLSSVLRLRQLPRLCQHQHHPGRRLGGARRDAVRSPGRARP